MHVLRAFFFLHFFALGSFLPYLTIHFRDINLTNAQIGILVSVMPLFITLSPTLWTQAADRTGRKKQLMIVACLCSALGFLALGTMRFFPYVLLLLCFSSFFRSPIGSLLEGATFEQIKASGGDYGHIRMFGSFGFIIAVLGIGQLYQRLGSSVIFFTVCIAGLSAAVIAFFLPASAPRRTDAKRVSFRVLLSNRTLMLYLGAAFLMRVSHAGYNTFYSIYLDSLGVPRGVIGVAWSLGVACEIVILIFSGRIVRRSGAQGLILMAFAAALLRWTLFASVTNPWILVAAQSLHGLSFGAFHVGSVMLVQSLVPDELRASGQGLFTSSAYGLGGILGAWFVGFVASKYSIPMVFATSVGIAFAGALLFVTVVLPRVRNVAPIGVGGAS